jgi:NAD(P)-dependent dehydrogenase (short-subunit alcohol dehydrogenase family)
VDLRDRVAIVTGGASGAGASIAARLASEGACVVIADVVAPPQAEGGGGSGSGGFVRTDVRVPADLERMVAFAVSAHGGLDVLVNNAGGWGPTANYPDASFLEWDAALDLNLRAPMLATQLALEPMRRRGGGAVVNVASTAGLGLAPYESPDYGAAKAGLIRFTACMAGAREATGVRVNCVVPDWIRTERAERELASMPPAARAAEEAVGLVELADLADAVVDLARDESLAGRVMLLPRGEPARLLDPA